MNLTFYFKADGRILGFPFQTPTTLSQAVMAAGTKQEKLRLLREEMEERTWDREYIYETLEAIEFCMDDPELSLVMQ